MPDSKNLPLVSPLDEHNQRLLSEVHPKTHRNPKPDGRYNLVAIGAGAAGLVSSAGLAGLGGRSALIERHLLGGDCLNVGCVPSKALLRAARAARDVRRAKEFGVVLPEGDVTVDFARVMERMRERRAHIAPNDSAKRFTELGVDVYLGDARFVSPGQVEVRGERLSFARAVIATGGRPRMPDIPGLLDLAPRTNLDLFWLTELPRRLLVLGGGPIGCEMAQAFAQFGAQVEILTRGRLLPREDEDASALVERAFRRQGVRLTLGAHAVRAERRGKAKVIHYEIDGEKYETQADEVLVALGRSPNVEGLGLEDAEVRVNERGIEVDDRLRSTNPRIYAAGDVAGGPQFTHAADAMARIVIQNAFFFGRAKASGLIMPWVTYLEPEVATVGLTARMAAERGIEIDTYETRWDHVDRALLEGMDEGFAKIHTHKGKDAIVGATIVGEHAGEMISEVTLAMTNGVGLKGFAKTIHPYPTRAEILKKLGDAYMRTKLTDKAARAMKWFLGVRR